MGVLLPQTAAAIGDCRDHIKLYPETDPVIAAYLTRYVNIALCAEIESVISQIIHDRIGRSCDKSAAMFFRQRRRNVIRNAKFAEIRKVVNQFGPHYEQRFSELAAQQLDDAKRTSLGNAVADRDSTAHEEPPQITFRELVDAYAAAEIVVGLVDLVLQE